MSESLHIVCPHCDGVNRVPAEKLGEQPTCGKCKRPLFDAHPVELNSGNFTRHISRNDIPVLVGAGGFLGNVVRPMPHDGSRLCAGGGTA